MRFSTASESDREKIECFCDQQYFAAGHVMYNQKPHGAWLRHGASELVVDVFYSWSDPEHDDSGLLGNSAQKITPSSAFSTP